MRGNRRTGPACPRDIGKHTHTMSTMADRLRRALPYGDECPVEGCSWDDVASELADRLDGSKKGSRSRPRRASMKEMLTALLVMVEAVRRLDCPMSFVEMTDGPGAKHLAPHLSADKRDALRHDLTAGLGPVIGELVFEMRNEKLEKYGEEDDEASVARAINDPSRVRQLLRVCLPHVRDRLSAPSHHLQRELGKDLLCSLMDVCELLEDCRGSLDKGQSCVRNALRVKQAVEAELMLLVVAIDTSGKA